MCALCDEPIVFYQGRWVHHYAKSYWETEQGMRHHAYPRKVSDD